jgi:hypothetical protein
VDTLKCCLLLSDSLGIQAYVNPKLVSSDKHLYTCSAKILSEMTACENQKCSAPCTCFFTTIQETRSNFANTLHLSPPQRRLNHLLLLFETKFMCTLQRHGLRNLVICMSWLRFKMHVLLGNLPSTHEPVQAATRSYTLPFAASS